MSYINTIGIANPLYKSDQMDIYDYMVDTIPYPDKEKKVLRYLYKKSGIETRYSVLPDFSATNGEERFYNTNNQYNPNVENRLSVYDKSALPLALEAIQNCLEDSTIPNSEITHLITISCTGMSAPGMDAEIIKTLNLSKSIQRFNINFMGCFAAINGLKLADTICRADTDARVLVVSVELCTLHFQNTISADYNLSNMLFADGAAATIVTGNKISEQSLQISGFHSDINNKGEEDMSWNITSSGFLMQLSSYVPKLLKAGFKDILDSIVSKYGIAFEELQHWAIHPGGKRILDNIEHEFALENGELNASRKVLKDYGNMSSPTILFVLKSMQEAENKTKGEYIFTAAFGPGLTTETALLRYA
ncbi:type III polyketide synthase [Portibacter lacus]|uniref:Naringenin-chalcone synthase n=1 Tax=Portibacter lacus TaxID=1099794 RepID=A0AA37SUV6_9BACT|nr:type III polyketide synthase [Portibacter lacus]GLR19984.1 naringenin-chalcone synthase [Portibacter lacus]